MFLKKNAAALAAEPIMRGEDCAIEMRHFSVHYGGFRAIKDVNLKFHRRGITAIIGPSGCGKSTVFSPAAGRKER